MKTIAFLVGSLALAVIVVASLGYVVGGVTLDACKAWLLGATFVWFAVYALALAAPESDAGADGGDTV